MDLTELLLGDWVAEDASKSLRVSRGPGGELRVTVWEGVGGKVLADDRPTSWKPRKDELPGRYARDRLGYLYIELGRPGMGCTYDLMPAVANEDVEAYGDFAWRAIDAESKREDVRLFPEEGASFYEAVLGAYDDYAQDMRPDWVEPLSTYRPATDDEALP